MGTEESTGTVVIAGAAMSTGTVVIAGAANLGIAVAKAVGGVISGSSAMLSEAAQTLRTRHPGITEVFLHPTPGPERPTS